MFNTKDNLQFNISSTTPSISSSLLNQNNETSSQPVETVTTPAPVATPETTTVATTPKPVVPDTISTQTLGTTAEKMTLPVANTPTTAIGLGSEITSLSNSSVQQMNAEDELLKQQKLETQKRQTETEKSKKNLLDFLGMRKGETALTDTAYTERNLLGTTVDETSRKLRNINNQINAIDISTNEQIKQLRSTFRGTTSGMQDSINAINRNATTAKADLYIDKLMAQGDYDSAKSIADRKVAVQMEQDKMDYDRFLATYNDNKEFFTKAEQRQFELMAKDREFAIQRKENELKQLNDTNIELQKNMALNGAPQSIKDAVSRATTTEDKIKLAGNYGISIEDRYKLGQIGALGTSGKAPTIQKINGVEMQWDSTTGRWITPTGTDVGATASGTNLLSQAQARDNIENITQLSQNMASSAVGTSPLSRSQPGFMRNTGKLLTGVGAPQALIGAKQRLTGEYQNFIAGVEQLRSNLNLDTLIQAKSRGATFGALSDQELNVLASAATKIGTWAIKDSNGQVIGYNTTEENMRKELDKINNYAKLDYIIKGGDPMDINAQLQADGSVWTKNSDGTYTQIK